MTTAANRYATYPSLLDRSVLITGGGSGIGASLVEHFAAQGARVAFLDIEETNSRILAEKLAAQCKHAPFFQPCDVTNISALQKAITQVTRECGAPRVLVNNAANDDRHKFADITPEYWDQRMAINLKHQFFAAQSVAPGMKAAGGGSIINMSSIAWMVPSPNLMVYSVAKTAIVGMTRSMAHELGPANIRVNSVLPGAILTQRQRDLWMPQEFLDHVLTLQCIKRNLMPDDVARLVLFLSADDSETITNQSHIIDGGWI